MEIMYNYFIESKIIGVNMKRGYLKKLISYMKKVYDIENGLMKLTDTRINPTYSTASVILPVLFGFLVRIKSFNELKYRLQSGDFKGLVLNQTKLPQIDTIRNTLKKVEIQGIQDINRGIIKTSIRNKVVRQGTIDGYTVAALDGTRLFGSQKKSCKHCAAQMKRNGKIDYSHNAVFMTLVGQKPRLIIDYEMYQGLVDSSKKEEGELTVAKRLLTRATKEHKHLLDVVVYDALASNSIWFNHCISCNVIPIVQVKGTHNLAIKVAKTQINKSEIKEAWQDQKRNRKIVAYEESFCLKGVDKPLRLVKFQQKNAQGKYTQVVVMTTDFTIALQTIYKIIHARWDIENSIFNNLKTYCELEHCYIHEMNAATAIIYLMSIAFNLMQVFMARRLKRSKLTQKEVVRLVDKELSNLRKSSTYRFNTS